MCKSASPGRRDGCYNYTHQSISVKTAKLGRCHSINKVSPERLLRACASVRVSLGGRGLVVVRGGGG